MKKHILSIAAVVLVLLGQVSYAQNTAGGTLDNDGDGFSVGQGDCDDNNTQIYPGAVEICDGLDNDCDGFIDLADPDGGLTTYTYYQDADSDGYGSTVAIATCLSTVPKGYAENNTDCDDENATVYPGATEIADNGIDEDCNGQDFLSSLTTIQAKFGVNVFPNPASDFVVLSGKLNSGYLITVVDMQGKQVLSQSAVQGTNCMLNITSLTSGFYTMVLTDKATAQHGFCPLAVVK